MNQYKLDIAGIQWEINTPVKVPVDEKISPFLTERFGSDMVLNFVLGKPEIPGNIIWERAPKVRKDGEQFWIERTLAAQAGPSGCVCMDIRNPTNLHGWIYPNREKDVKSLETLLDMSELEILLSHFNTFCLHSSLISWKGRGVLFTAPSGTGKSTQAGLWELFRGAEQINGDRSLIRLKDGIWTAYGSPFAGSSGIYKNENAPIGIITVLRQDKENSIIPLSAPEAFRLLYSETVIPKWHKQAHERIIQMLMQIVEDVPIIMMKCLPDQSAVETLEQCITRIERMK